MAKKQYLHLLAACVAVAVVTCFFTTRRYVDLPLVPPRLIVNSGDASELLAFCPDGATILSASGSRAQLKDINTGTVRCNLEGHRDQIHGLAVAPNGLTAATGSEDGTVRLWELPGGLPLKVFKGTHGSVQAVAAGNGWVAAGYEDGAIVVWSRDGRQLASFQDHLLGVTALALRPSDEALVSASADGTVKVRRVPDGKLLANYKVYRDRPVALACCPQGTRIACATGEGRVLLWPSEKSEAVSSPHFPQGVKSLAFADDQSLLAAGRDFRSHEKQEVGFVFRWTPGTAPEKLKSVECDGTFALSRGRATLACNSCHKAVDIWDLGSLQKLHSIPEQPLLDSVEFSSDGGQLVVGADNRTYLWTLGTGLLEGLPGGGPVALSRHGQRMATLLDSQDSGPYILQIRDLTHPGEKTLDVSLAQDPERLTFNEDGSKLFFFDRRQVIHELDARSATSLYRYPTQSWASRFAPSNRWLAYTSERDYKDILQLADLRTRKIVTLDGPIEHLSFDGDLRLSPDEHWLALLCRTNGSESGGTLRLYELSTRKLVFRSHIASGQLKGCRWSPDSSRLAFNAGETVVLLDVAKRQELYRTTGGSDFAFSPDGASLATLGKGGLAIEDIASRKRRLLDALGEPAGGRLAYSPDGRLLAVCNPWSVRLFDTAAGEQLASLIVLQPGDEWLVVTPGGLYDASPEAARRLAWRMGDQTYRLDQFSKLFEHKGLLARLIAGERPRPVQHLLHPPPKVQIASLLPEQDVAEAAPEVVVSATDQGGGIGFVHLVVNGQEATPLAGQTRAKFRVALRPGLNHLRAYASDADDLMLSASHEFNVFYRTSDPAR